MLQVSPEFVGASQVTRVGRINPEEGKSRIFDRPDLLNNQTRLILSADMKPKRLIRSASRPISAGQNLNRINSASTAILEDDLDEEGEELDRDGDDGSELDDVGGTTLHRQHSAQIDYDTDIEQEREPLRDFSCKGLYLEECRKYGVIPSTHYLRNLNSESLIIRYYGMKPINVKVMVPSLKINTSITKLDMNENGLGSRGAIYIAQLIKDNEYITDLNLSNNDIGVQGKTLLSIKNFLT
ncbi:unnamed protein product [Didymodactylos carnosus]|uniref:Uncharacterized protein n=1 Tax=Didymodactylos carnosus TaxID=1234261 RepID=A0A816CJ85_9BILA|nr:unnamed protein product [Didymodactylos carnosus]CAF1625219.1 unnamed protein product [Didymodactylos carnosus]CAF3826530.1 unnamed protein product [Didymodactylos carnosus]CAF4518628.1 unnamed protein product [Didymodactylos carnosus]